MQTSIKFLAKFLSPVYLLAALTAFASDVEITSGIWIEKGYTIKGEWKVVQRDDTTVVVFSDSFRTRKGPDLEVYLSRNAINSLGDKNVESTSVKIGPLKSNKGRQEYELPPSINLDEFSSLVIHCEKYAHLWGGADLKME